MPTPQTRPPSESEAQKGWRSNWIVAGIVVVMLAVGGYFAYGILFPNPVADFVGEWRTDDGTQRLVFTEQGDCVYCLSDFYFSIPAERLNYVEGRVSFKYWSEVLEDDFHLVAELDDAGKIELRPYAKSDEASRLLVRRIHQNSLLI